MKTSKLAIAAVLFFLPILFTTMWFYSGLPVRQEAALPDFPTIDLPMQPISTPIALPTPPKTTTSRVVFDMNHANMFSLSEIDPLLRNIESHGGEISLYREEGSLAETLKSASSIVSIAPMNTFSHEEMQAISNFVHTGGRLVIITDPTRNTQFTDGGLFGMSGVDSANLLLEPFDLSFKDDYLYNLVENEGNFRNIIISDFPTNILMKDVGQLVLYGTHSLSPNGYALAGVNDDTVSSAEQADELSPIRIIKAGSGQVLAIGDVSMMTTQYAQSADNQVFIQNLAKFLTTNARSKTLSDFPFVFEGQVAVQLVGDIKMNGELLSAISTLEKSLETGSGDLTISKKPQEKLDRIVLTTYKTNDETEEIFAVLGIKLNPEPSNLEESNSIEEEPAPADDVPLPTLEPEVSDIETPSFFTEAPPFGSILAEIESPEISLPGMDIIATDGLGVVGLVQEENRLTLVLMASSPEKIQELINQISFDGLQNCLVNSNVAACRISAEFPIPAG